MSAESPESKLIKIMPFPALHACGCLKCLLHEVSPSQPHRLAAVALNKLCINMQSRYTKGKARRVPYTIGRARLVYKIFLLIENCKSLVLKREIDWQTITCE